MKNSKWTFYAVIIAVNCFNNLHSWISPFIIGLVIAEMAQLGIFQKIEGTTKGFVLKIALIAVGLLFFVADYWFINGNGDSVFLVGFSHVSMDDRQRLPRYDEVNINYLVVGTCLIAYLELSAGLRWFFGSPPFAFLGRISFGMYLLHPLVIPSVGSLIAYYIFNPAFELDRDLASCLTVIMILICSSIASWVFYYVADKPSIELGRYFEGYFFSKNLSLKELKARLTMSGSSDTVYEEVGSADSDQIVVKVLDD
jgi:peptidoglycan/LPS O-acetylase OafA/YrhL